LPPAHYQSGWNNDPLESGNDEVGAGPATVVEPVMAGVAESVRVAAGWRLELQP
jgi:hypothetical protein